MLHRVIFRFGGQDASEITLRVEKSWPQGHLSVALNSCAKIRFSKAESQTAGKRAEVPHMTRRERKHAQGARSQHSCCSRPCQGLLPSYRLQ